MNSFAKFQRFIVALLLLTSGFYGGYFVGKKGFIFEVRKNPPSIKILNQTPKDQTIDFGQFWQVWDLVSKDFLDRPVDSQKMLYGAISGMVSSLGDPYTSYLPPVVNKSVGEALNGTYQGIGAELGVKDNQLIIVSPLDGSPAKYAGLKAGDRILEIEGVSTAGLGVSEAVSKIRGSSGTTISLKIQTDDKEPRELKITRGTINIASVTWEDKGDGVAYIRVSRFGGDTNKEWSRVVKEVNTKMSELDSIILDLRGNPGGYLQSAVYLAEEFMKDKVVLYQESATGKQDPMKALRIGDFHQVPQVLVLIDNGSASASEILAAALRDNLNVKLIGVKSFGKGTIQDAKEFEDGSGVHITIAKWLTPKKQWVHGVGLEPDIKIERAEDESEKGIDSQLDKALEIAKQI